MLFLKYSPAVIAVAMVYFSLICLGIKVPSQGAQLSWWKVGILVNFNLYKLAPAAKLIISIRVVTEFQSPLGEFRYEV